VPRIASIAIAQPAHLFAQARAREFCRALFSGAHTDIERLLEVFENAAIDERRVSVPIEWFSRQHTFAEKNALYIEKALALSERAARDALAAAHLAPGDIDHLLFVSSTGVATPSLDGRLMNRLRFSPHMRRTPIWGLGCAGGAAGLARAAEWAELSAGSNVLLIAIELCSLTFQREDLSKSNLVATALFGDGAAAVVVRSEARENGGGGHARSEARESDGGAAAGSDPAHGRPGPRIVASRSTLFPDTEDVMGWDVNDAGLKVLFSRDIPVIVRRFVRENADEFLAEHGLTLQSVRHLIAHPGGVKVMAAYEEAFGLEPSALRHAREVLRSAGNMSSPTVLFVLERFLADSSVRPGDWGLLTALGPGFSSELVLLRW